MAEPVDLKTFKPNDAGEMVTGIISHIAGLLKDKLQRFEQEFARYVGDLAKASLAVTSLLKDNTYDRRQADIALHSQELLVNSALLRAEFLTYELAQSVLKTVFKIVSAVIKNFTGVSIKF